MYGLLIRLIVLASILELGLSFTDTQSCHSYECQKRLDTASRKVLNIPWKPISIFPEEAKRFR